MPKYPKHPDPIKVAIQLYGEDIELADELRALMKMKSRSAIIRLALRVLREDYVKVLPPAKEEKKPVMRLSPPQRVAQEKSLRQSILEELFGDDSG